MQWWSDWTELNWIFIDHPSRETQRCMGPAWEKSWVKLPGCGSNGLWLLIIVSLLVTYSLAHGRCSTNICEPNERRASIVKEKALYESGGRGVHLHQAPTCQHSYMHCVSYLYNSVPFYKRENVAQRSQATCPSHSAPSRQDCKMQLNCDLDFPHSISRLSIDPISWL